MWLLQHFLSITICWFALKLSGFLQYSEMHKMNTLFLFFWLIAMVTAKNAVFLVILATITRIEKSFFHFIQNNKLINLTKFQSKLITLCWDKMSQSALSMSVAVGIAHSSKGRKILKVVKIVIFSYNLSCYIKICSMLWLIVKFWYFSPIFWIWVEEPVDLVNKPVSLCYQF